MSELDDYWYVVGWLRGQRLVEDGVKDTDAPAPLSGELAGYSIPEIFGSWEAATQEAMDDYEDGYWDALVGHDNRTVHDE